MDETDDCRDSFFSHGVHERWPLKMLRLFQAHPLEALPLTCHSPDCHYLEIEEADEQCWETKKLKMAFDGKEIVGVVLDSGKSGQEVDIVCYPISEGHMVNLLGLLVFANCNAFERETAGDDCWLWDVEALL